MDKKLNVSVSDVKHMENSDFSVWFATVRIGKTKHRKAVVKTSNEFKKHIRAKILAYCKKREK